MEYQYCIIMINVILFQVLGSIWAFETCWWTYGECRASCGGTGSRTTRYRCCDDLEIAFNVQEGCTEDRYGSESCSKSNGNWGTWTVWSVCSVTCDYGSRTRTRACNNPPPTAGCAYCSESNTDNVQCYVQPVHGGWGLWSPYTTCTEPCAGGTHTRTRTCNNPIPAKCGNTCPGDRTETSACNTQGCPRPGKWGPWNAWSQCSVTCATGTRRRQRECNNPPPTNGGADCDGSNTATTQCSIPAVNGGWGQWSQYGPCTESCDGGTRTRERRCNSPSPANCGNDCPGASTDSVSCNTQGCPVNGNWSSWSAWTQCSVTCGECTRRQDRDCNNPVPQNGGKFCTGNSWEIGGCTITPVHGGWGQWTKYSLCTNTCDGGTQTRSRDCDNPTPANCGSDCPADSSQDSICNPQKCPEKGDFTTTNPRHIRSSTLFDATSVLPRETEERSAFNSGVLTGTVIYVIIGAVVGVIVIIAVILAVVCTIRYRRNTATCANKADSKQSYDSPVYQTAATDSPRTDESPVYQGLDKDTENAYDSIQDNV